jgi:uncharacterized protein (DUF885 family)
MNRRRAAHLVARTALLLATSPAALLALPAAAQEPRPDARLAALAERYYRDNFALFPIDATEAIGDPAYEDKLEVDISPTHRVRQRQHYERTLRALAAIDAARLNRTDRLTYQLLEYDARQRLALQAVPYHLMPVGHMDSLPVRIGRWAGGQASQPLKTTANYRHFLARLQRLPAWIDQAIANMEQGMARGIVLPRAIVERTLPQLEALLPADLEQSPYLAGVKTFPDSVPAADREQLRAAYRATVEKSVAPAVRRLHRFMADRYLPRAATTSGIGALPGGADWYRLLVRWSTTTDLTPQQIHDMGLKEVARIRGEMEQVKARFGFVGPLPEFLKSLAQRPELTPFRTESEVLAAYGVLNEKVKAGLPKLFETAPKAALEIRAVDAISRATASDNYVPPSADGSRPGAFYTVVMDPAKYSTTRMAALFLHEGQPGHHYQMATQQELDVPRFRKTLWYDAYGEGWALYAEGLGRELGLYEDPNAYLGRLLMELHRAMRLVVDTGLHDQGWSRERAIAYLRENEGSSEEAARRAAERYMAWPGQALAYKVGELKLLELRERARKQLGERFDVRAFHTQVLSDGNMPLAMLEAKIDAWIAGQR